MIIYRATGMVLGNCWGGGQVGYRAEQLKADSLSELRNKINAGIADGSLDSGMGFESLIGAVMLIETIDNREIGGKMFTAVNSEDEVFGKLTEEQVDFLTEAIYSQ